MPTRNPSGGGGQHSKAPAAHSKLRKLGLLDSRTSKAQPSKQLTFEIFFPRPPYRGAEYRAARGKDQLYNFVGLVLGHGGATVQRIQKASGAKVELRDSAGNLHGAHPSSHGDPSLHAWVSAGTRQRLDKAVQLLLEVVQPTNTVLRPITVVVGGSVVLEPLIPSDWPEGAGAGETEEPGCARTGTGSGAGAGAVKAAAAAAAAAIASPETPAPAPPSTSPPTNAWSTNRLLAQHKKQQQQMQKPREQQQEQQQQEQDACQFSPVSSLQPAQEAAGSSKTSSEHSEGEGSGCDLSTAPLPPPAPPRPPVCRALEPTLPKPQPPAQPPAQPQLQPQAPPHSQPVMATVWAKGLHLTESLELPSTPSSSAERILIPALSTSRGSSGSMMAPTGSSSSMMTPTGSSGSMMAPAGCSWSLWDQGSSTSSFYEQLQAAASDSCFSGLAVGSSSGGGGGGSGGMEALQLASSPSGAHMLPSSPLAVTGGPHMQPSLLSGTGAPHMQPSLLSGTGGPHLLQHLLPLPSRQLPAPFPGLGMHMGMGGPGGGLGLGAGLSPVLSPTPAHHSLHVKSPSSDAEHEMQQLLAAVASMATHEC